MNTDTPSESSTPNPNSFEEWWNKRSKATKIILIIISVILFLNIISTCMEDTTDISLTDEVTCECVENCAFYSALQHGYKLHSIKTGKYNNNIIIEYNLTYTGKESTSLSLLLSASTRAGQEIRVNKTEFFVNGKPSREVYPNENIIYRVAIDGSNSSSPKDYSLVKAPSDNKKQPSLKCP